MRRLNNYEINLIGKKKKSGIVALCLLFLLLIVFILILTNRRWIYDFYRGLTYRPTEKVEEIRDSLELTNYGSFLFNASLPSLEERENFNVYCRERENTGAILGCYRNNNIYVYNIVESELDGIIEVTMAHELLHAEYDRMSENEKSGLKDSLERVLKDNSDILENDLKNYEEALKMEELYVRAGTEILELPEDLEKHYARIFKDQDVIANYYNKYIVKFREIEEKLTRLNSELKILNDDIVIKTELYKIRVENLNEEILDFNRCAETAGCFLSESDFYYTRAGIVGKQRDLDGFYQEIDGLIVMYNQKVQEYNENLLVGEKLNSAINSSIKVEEVE